MRDFNHTIDVLVKAYMNDTLAHGKCTACAVGNIVADTMNTRYAKSIFEKSGIDCWYFENGYKVKWAELFHTTSDLVQKYYSDYLDSVKPEIERTGYSVNELMKIEFAFESAPKNCKDTDYKNDEWMLNGLMAVIDVLADIHGISLEAKEETKKLFVKA